MKPGALTAAALGLLLAVPPGATAQQPDYLTPEEVTLVRDTQEPNKRILLFLKFADERLLLFEKALAAPAGEAPADPAARKDMVNNFIRAVDDAAEVLDTALDRGGVDLRKTRPLLIKSGAEFRKRLEQAQQTEPGQSEDLRYDLEDAVLALDDLAELVKKIPEAPIPPKGPVVAGQEGKEGGEEEAPPGKPTLKRRPPPPPKPK
jgi:hypothetical protein